MGLQWLSFLNKPTSPGIWKHAISIQWLAGSNPNQGHGLSCHSPHEFWSSYEYLSSS